MTQLAATGFEPGTVRLRIQRAINCATTPHTRHRHLIISTALFLCVMSWQWYQNTAVTTHSFWCCMIKHLRCLSTVFYINFCFYLFTCYVVVLLSLFIFKVLFFIYVHFCSFFILSQQGVTDVLGWVSVYNLPYYDVMHLFTVKLSRVDSSKLIVVNVSVSSVLRNVFCFNRW